MQAFPIVQPPGALIIESGATLRDIFAAHAIQALIIRGPAPGQPAQEFIADSAAVAYMHADAMISARTAAPIEIPATQ